MLFFLDILAAVASLNLKVPIIAMIAKITAIIVINIITIIAIIVIILINNTMVINIITIIMKNTTSDTINIFFLQNKTYKSKWRLSSRSRKGEESDSLRSMAVLAGRAK